MTRAVSLILAAALLLPACSSDGGYPSLARRPAERVSGSASAVEPDATTVRVATPADAALTDRLDTLVAAAEAAHRRFADERERAGTLVSAAAGAPVASESWAVATVALASLESARSEVMIALADLDALHVSAEIEHFGTANGDVAAIAAARDRVIALVASEDAVLASLRGRLRS